MTPRPRIYKTHAERMAAYRARKQKEGKERMEITVSMATAKRLRTEAKARGCSIGEALESLLAGK